MRFLIGSSESYPLVHSETTIYNLTNKFSFYQQNINDKDRCVKNRMNKAEDEVCEDATNVTMNNDNDDDNDDGGDDGEDNYGGGDDGDGDGGGNVNIKVML